MKTYTENSSSSTPSPEPVRPAERVKFSSQIPAVLLTTALVVGSVAWMQHSEAGRRTAAIEPLRVQNEALKLQADENRRQLESTTKILKEALARHDGEVFRTEDEIQKLNDDRVGLLADAITRKIVPALPPVKTPEEAQRAENEQIDKVATRLTESLTPLISRVSDGQAAERKATAQKISQYEERIQTLDSNLQRTQAAAQDTLRLTHEVSAMYLDSYKDHGVVMRLFSLPASLVTDVANGNLLNARERKKVQEDLNTKMSELDRRLREVQTSPLASNTTPTNGG
jgi:hypothetical protein